MISISPEQLLFVDKRLYLFSSSLPTVMAYEDGDSSSKRLLWREERRKKTDKMRTAPSATDLHLVDQDRREAGPNYECLFGLLPYGVIFARSGSFVALAVVCNAAFFHAVCPNSTIMKKIDVACNVGLATYANIRGKNNTVLALTFGGVCSFLLNGYITANEQKKHIVHVLCAQWFLLAALVAHGL